MWNRSPRIYSKRFWTLFLQKLKRYEVLADRFSCRLFFCPRKETTMKKFLITYDVRYYEDGTDQTGETCTTLEVAAKSSTPSICKWTPKQVKRNSVHSATKCGVIDKLNKIL